MSSLLLNYSRNFIRTSEKLTNLIITRSASRFTIKYKLLKPGEDHRIAQGRLSNKGNIDRAQKLVMSSEESNSKENLKNSSSDGCGNGGKSSSGDETASRDDIFEGKVDRFRGVTVHSESEYDLCKNFSEKLQKSLEHWCNNKNRCIWFLVQTAHADWIPELVKAQFEFHHAGKGMAVLYRWLPKDETDNIPEYAHTMIGVGAVILNDNNEILTVSERYTIVANSWKLPGGYVDRNENFVEAAVREVKEETGIDCEFDTVISLRHTHHANFNTSDLYIVMGMKPCTFEYRLDDREIAKIEWMPVDIYLNHPKVHEMNRFFVHKYLNMKKNTTRIRRTEATHSVTKRLVNLYHLQDCLADNDEDRLILQEKKKDNYKNNL